jgi:hypothetical protein
MGIHDSITYVSLVGAHHPMVDLPPKTNLAWNGSIQDGVETMVSFQVWDCKRIVGVGYSGRISPVSGWGCMESALSGRVVLGGCDGG